MDQFVVDVTCISGVEPGEPVVLMGTDGDLTISAELLGKAASGFHYEQVCDIGHRVTRVYVQGGKETAWVSYLQGPEN